MELDTKDLKTANELVEDKLMKYKKKKNIELYKPYKIFSYDLIFYYAIIYLFLTIQKGLTPAEVLKFDAFYVFFKFLVQIPVTLLIQRIGKRNSIVFASFINVIHVLFIIFANSFPVLLLSQFLCAIGFTIKATCETDMLYDSIEHGEKRGSTFAKIDGKATSRHYYMEAISSAISGFLFVINPYFPMILCFLVLLIVAIISTNFEDVQTYTKKDTIKEEYRNIKYSFRDIFRSKRLVSLLLFNSLMVAMIKIFQNVRNTVLVEIAMPQQYFGVIFAILEIVAGIAAKYQNKIHDRYRNKTLTFLGYPIAISFLLLGLLLSLGIDLRISIPIILVLFIIQYLVRGPYYVIIKRYINNFTNGEKRVKIATVNNLIENLIASILMFGSAFVLDSLPINITLIIVGCVATILVVLLLDRMRHTVGLKMEQYDKKEIL